MELVKVIWSYLLLPFLCNNSASHSCHFESQLTLHQLPLLLIVKVDYSSQQSHPGFQPLQKFALLSSVGHWYILIIAHLCTEAAFSAPSSPFANDGGYSDFEMET